MPAEIIKAYLLEEVDRAAFHGGIAAFAHAGKIKAIIPFGNASTKPKTVPTTESTLYDLASLTKPLITTTIILYLVQSGLLSLESKIGRIYADCPDDKRDITINNLLCHSSGILGWYPLYAEAENISGYTKYILTLPLQAARETETIYSCPNFIILADVIQRITSLPFAKAAMEMIIKPLELKSSFLCRVDTARYCVAATEEDSFTEAKMLREMKLSYTLRKGVICGEVHDCNSYAAGGTAGNAGLFSNVEETIVLAEQFTPRSILLDENTRKLLNINQTPFGPQHRVPGWQLASSPDCSAGQALSDKAIGHTGFTGTSLWWDPEDDFTYILFTNRVHPEINITNINPIRRKVHQLVKASYSKEVIS